MPPSTPPTAPLIVFIKKRSYERNNYFGFNRVDWQADFGYCARLSKYVLCCWYVLSRVLQSIHSFYTTKLLFTFSSESTTTCSQNQAFDVLCFSITKAWYGYFSMSCDSKTMWCARWVLSNINEWCKRGRSASFFPRLMIVEIVFCWLTIVIGSFSVKRTKTTQWQTPQWKLYSWFFTFMF